MPISTSTAAPQVAKKVARVFALRTTRFGQGVGIVGGLGTILLRESRFERPARRSFPRLCCAGARTRSGLITATDCGCGLAISRATPGRRIDRFWRRSGLSSEKFGSIPQGVMRRERKGSSSIASQLRKPARPAVSFVHILKQPTGISKGGFLRYEKSTKTLIAPPVAA